MSVKSWKNAASDNWSVSPNWNSGIPTTADTAEIAIDGNYTVQLDVDAGIAGFTLGSTTRGSQTLNKNGRTLTLNGTSTVNSKGVLNLQTMI